MKLLRLDLLAFGPFTGTTLDLSAGTHGLHLIYGPNEAGKTSALRALRHLFYEIPERSPDDFLHLSKNLRIGAAVRHSDGSELEFIRRKGRKNTLRGPDDDTVLGEAELGRFLGGVDQGLFGTLFGIDHEALVKGGQEIVQGGGQLGQVLFTASSGIAGLRTVQEGLQTEMRELFLPSGRNQKITRAIQEFRVLQAAVKTQQLPCDDWVRHDRDLHTAQEKREHLEARWQLTTRDHNRHTRIRTAQPAIARRKGLLAELEGYCDAVLLPADFAAQYSEALTALRLAESRAAQAQENLEKNDLLLQKVQVPETLLERAEAIEKLRESLGSHRKALTDRQRLLGCCQQEEHEAREILRSLNRADDLAQAEPLRLGVDEAIKIQNLGNQQQGLLANRDNARAAVAGLQGRIEQARRDLGLLPALQDPADLQKTIRLAQKEGTLEENLAGELARLREVEQQAVIDRGKLRLWSGTLEDLEKLPVPATETIDTFDHDLETLETTLKNLRHQQEQEAEAIRIAEGQLDQLKLEQEVPTEEALAEARKLRETGWRLVRRAWQERQDNTDEARVFVTSFEPARPDLAEAYEASVQRADLVADRLRREANRVATRAKLLADRNQHQDRCQRLARQLDDGTSRLQQLQQKWLALWQPLGIEPLSPREMQAWLRKQQDLEKLSKILRDQRDLVERLQHGIQTHQARLVAALEGLGESAKNAPESLALVLERSQEVVQRLLNVKKRYEDLQKDIAGQQQELHQAEARARLADKDLAQWQSLWAGALARLGLETDATPAQANAVLEAIRELFKKLHEAKSFRLRIKGIDADAQQFTADVQAQVQQVAPDLASLDVERAAEELNTRLIRAREARQEQQTLLTRKAQEINNLQEAQDTLKNATIRLEAMSSQASCSTYEELPSAEQRSTRRRQLEQEIHQCHEQLLELSAGAPVDDFVAGAELLDADALDPQIGRLEEQLEELRHNISDVDKTIGSELTELARMNGNGAAAEAADLAENLLAQLQSDVQHYAVVRLAAVVLQKSIERYRDRNQGPLLARASEVFAGLTVGSYEGLRIDYDRGEPVLTGVRCGGRETVAVEGMSDGSCDQLYLALRLASLETWLSSHEPLPFIVDDILLNFDNERAVAALQALAGLSRHTQVIFFTHHQHLVELAVLHLDPAVLCTHLLPDRLPAAS